MGVPLPPKEANQFKLIVKSYETKQYKKGIKAADSILKKFPDHGETLSMKGLTLNCMSRKEEAYELVRKGLKNDLKSHVCWHVYGLLYRSDREYREAIKCYRNALRIDPENIQILRDLSLLQAQMRDMGGFVETRRQLLTLKPAHRNNWIAFALAQHISGNPSMAVQILEAYEGTLEEDYPPATERYEHSELLLYKVMVLEESEQPERALDQLVQQEDKIVDTLELQEQRAKLLLKLQRPAEAERVYRALLASNPDNYKYYAGLQACLGLGAAENGTYSASKVEKLALLYKDLQGLFPRSAAAKRIPLDFLEGEAFEAAVDAYMRPLLRKGVPSLFADLKPLYNRSGKADLIEKVILRIEESVRTTGNFPGEGGVDATPRDTDKKEQEPPWVLLWTLYFLAQHYDRRRCYTVALEKVEEAIAHTPTTIELYLAKASIMKHAGDTSAAASLADEARSMDLADRFLNSNCVKRLLQADQVAQAEKTAALFTKDGEQHDNLFDMQAMWYELQSGSSQLRQKQYGKALKKFLAVNKHYCDMLEDQFDFHTYCLRKTTLRAYVHMLRFEDTLHSQRCFCRGAQGAIRCYLALHHSPVKTSGETDEVELGSMSAADRKKLRQKQRKAEARAKKEAEEKVKEEEEKAAAAAVAAAKGGKKAAATPARPVDTDPEGVALAAVEDPLAEALKQLELLLAHAGEQLETQLLAFEIHIARSRLLLAIQALKRQLRVAPGAASVHRCLIRYFHAIDALPQAAGKQEELVRTVIAAERADLRELGPGKTLEAVNEEFLEAHSESLPHRGAAAEMLALLAPDKRQQAVQIVETSVNPQAMKGEMIAAGASRWELQDCRDIHALLEGPLQDPAAAARWRDRCAELFPFSTYFRGARSSVMSGTPANGIGESDIEAPTTPPQSSMNGISRAHKA